MTSPEVLARHPRHRWRHLFLVVFWLWTGVASASAESLTWDPSKTRALIVGVLNWQDPSIGTFSTQDRKDQELYQTLLGRGVPSENITLLLDNQATHAQILNSLRESLKLSQSDEMFLFYYAGHGLIRKGEIVFVPYDFGRAKGLSMDELSHLMGTETKAERVLLLADCCFSGGLASVADELESLGISAASLTSTTELRPSVSNWTYTQMLIDALRGSAAADRNADRVITLGELAEEVGDAMKFHENQQYGVSPRPWLQDFTLVSSEQAEKSEVPLPYRPHDYVQIATTPDTWKNGRLVGFEQGQFVVELQGYSQRTPQRVGSEQIRQLPTLPVRIDDPQEALRLASVDGKYRDLLQTLEVEPDYLEYSAYQDFGINPACNYAGRGPIPEGYWVYLYPNWYVWKSQTAKDKDDSL